MTNIIYVLIPIVIAGIAITYGVQSAKRRLKRHVSLEDSLHNLRDWDVSLLLKEIVYAFNTNRAKRLGCS